VLDLKMPYRNGLDVLQWVRRHPTFKTLVTVILSSSRQESDVNQAYALGANSYLKKPCSYGDYVEMTRVLVNYWSRWVERPPANVPEAGALDSSFHIT